MTAAAAPPGSPGQTSAAAPTAAATDSCPLCGAPLQADQEWCLKCGAAARTRLAAVPDWKAPLLTLAVIGALALGILAASLVKLAGDSGPAPAPRTTTVTSTQPPAASTPATTAPSTSAPATSTPTTATAPASGTSTAGK